MNDRVRIPAQAAYEAFLAGAVGAMPHDLIAALRLDFSKLTAAQKALWGDVANAAVLSTMLCDRETQAEAFGLRQGTRVRRTRADYRFEGNVAVIFAKRSGAVRTVVEDDDGLMLILKPNQLEPVE